MGVTAGPVHCSAWLGVAELEFVFGINGDGAALQESFENLVGFVVVDWRVELIHRLDGVMAARLVGLSLVRRLRMESRSWLGFAVGGGLGWAAGVGVGSAKRISTSHVT